MGSFAERPYTSSALVDQGVRLRRFTHPYPFYVPYAEERRSALASLTRRSLAQDPLTSG